MLNPKMPTFEGEASWTPKGSGTKQAVHMLCRLRTTDSMILELALGSWKYDAWLTRTGGDLFKGAYEVRKEGKVLRGTITCSLNQLDGFVQLEGTLEEGGFDYDWDGQLQRV